MGRSFVQRSPAVCVCVLGARAGGGRGILEFDQVQQ